MHRQSLSSPVSKLHSHGGGGGGSKDQNLAIEEDSLASSSSLADYDEESKSTKLRRLLSSTPSSSRSDKLIHLIPLLTFLCFLVLYLCSHDASDLDLVEFNGLKRLRKNIDSTEIGQFIDLRRSDALAIRSLKNFPEIGRGTRKSRSHRKIADF